MHKAQQIRCKAKHKAQRTGGKNEVLELAIYSCLALAAHVELIVSIIHLRVVFLMQDFYIQTMEVDEGDSGKFGFDPLDCTKVWFPLCWISAAM